MASTPLFNQVASQALRGEDALVTLSSAAAAQYMLSINLGQRCSVNSTGYVGYVSQVDSYGITFKVKPLATPYGYFCSTINTSGGGILNVNEQINLFPFGQ